MEYRSRLRHGKDEILAGVFSNAEERATLQTLRGDQRDEYVRRFLVYQIGDKEARKV